MRDPGDQRWWGSLANIATLLERPPHSVLGAVQYEYGSNRSEGAKALAADIRSALATPDPPSARATDEQERIMALGRMLDRAIRDGQARVVYTRDRMEHWWLQVDRVSISASERDLIDYRRRVARETPVWCGSYKVHDEHGYVAADSSAWHCLGVDEHAVFGGTDDGGPT